MQVVGRLGEKPPVEGRDVKGLLVRQGAEDLIMAAADLPSFTKLHTGRILQRQAILITQPFAKVNSQQTITRKTNGKKQANKTEQMRLKVTER